MMPLIKALLAGALFSLICLVNLPVNPAHANDPTTTITQLASGVALPCDYVTGEDLGALGALESSLMPVNCGVKSATSMNSTRRGRCDDSGGTFANGTTVLSLDTRRFTSTVRLLCSTNGSNAADDPGGPQLTQGRLTPAS